MKMLELGGNARLSAFFDHFDLNSEDIKIKFNTCASHHYRKALSAEVDNEEMTELVPNYDDGRMLFSG